MGSHPFQFGPEANHLSTRYFFFLNRTLLPSASLVAM